MKIATGKVVGGKVVLEGEPLSEGSIVTVLAQENDETFDATPEEEQALLEAMAEAEPVRLCPGKACDVWVGWGPVRDDRSRMTLLSKLLNKRQLG